jgi:hypothetical protein
MHGLGNGRQPYLFNKSIVNIQSKITTRHNNVGFTDFQQLFQILFCDQPKP